MTNIRERLTAHYQKAVDNYGRDAVLGVFLYGSWNYNTNFPDSDVDTKCILIPDLYHLACKPYETKHLAVDDEVCECMTIQHMIANWKKQNINFVEVLFTPYYIVNPMYEELWKKFKAEMANYIASYDIKKAVLSMSYQALNTYKQNPNDNKKQMNMTRICASLHRLTSQCFDYWDCIAFEDEVADELRDIRLHGALPADIKDRLDNLEWYIAHADDYESDPFLQQWVDTKLDDWTLEFIRVRLDKS